MKVYIDCGAFIGDTVDCEKLFGFKADKKIAFEANKRLLKELKTQGFDEVYNKVVWVDDGDVTFYQDQSKFPMGSTMKSSKTTGILQPVEAKAIDFSSWLSRYMGDTVIIKMDIEGAEFDVLRKMIDDGTINIPKKLFVEFHPNKVPEYTTTDKLDLVNEIKTLGVDIMEWH